MTSLNFYVLCVAAELHMLTLLENLKHQLNQQSSVMNLLMSRLNAAREPPSEMPDDISFPLSSLTEVDCFEDWLNDPANAMKKKQLVYISCKHHFSLYYVLSQEFLSYCFFSFIANSVPYFYRSLSWPLLGDVTKNMSPGILTHIFSSSVAKQINWKGVNNKKKFSEMATKALLARKCELYTYCSSKCQMSSANLALSLVKWSLLFHTKLHCGIKWQKTKCWVGNFWTITFCLLCVFFLF